MSERRGDRVRVDNRFRLLRTLMVAAGVLLAARVVHVQIFLHDRYRARAEDQWGDEVATHAERGNLYDRHGRPLALSVTKWDLGVTKADIRDADRLYAVLADILDRPAAELRRQVDRRDHNYVPLARDLVLGEEQRRRLHIEGCGAVALDPVYSRIYPTDGVGASLVGRFRPDPERDLTTGLENAFNGVLAGRPGRARELLTGATARKRGKLVLEEARHGQSLVLTLDADLQSLCEERLHAAVDEYGAVGGSILIMDPHNGDVLAAASWPLMDTRDRRHPDGAVWNNRNFTHLFEPGSVAKVFTTASLLRHGAVDTQTVYDCDNGSGPEVYVRNDGGHDYGPLSLMRAFSKSSNVYFAKASANLRPSEFYRDLMDFGFGQRTAAPYPGQPEGILHSPETWSGRSLQTLSIGQEMAVTAVQLGSALCAVANGGTLYTPRLVDEIRDERGRTLERIAPQPLRRVVSPQLAVLLREAMARVVRDGTGQGAGADWITVGGKTGTAQKSRDGRGYTGGAYVASFGGLVPVDDPRLVVLTVLDEPKGYRHYAAQSAVPLFRNVVSDIRRSTDWLTDVPGARTAAFDRADPERLVTVPDVMYLAVSSATRQVAARGLALAGAEREGQVVQQVPQAGTRCAPGTVVTLTVADAVAAAPAAPAEPGLCPDFSGLSNRQVRSLAARLHIPVRLDGVGYAERQSVAPGQRWSAEGVRIRMRGSRL